MRIYDLEELRQVSRRFQVSLTELLTTVMAASIMELELKAGEKNYEPIQIMVPVNLRKKFKSITLRNFSLYALPCVETDWFSMPFDTLLNRISAQLREQLSEEYLTGMITAAVRLQDMRVVRCIPLKIRETELLPFAANCLLISAGEAKKQSWNRSFSDVWIG